jgi:replication-associated recombination protein RarA
MIGPLPDRDPDRCATKQASRNGGKPVMQYRTVGGCEFGGVTLAMQQAVRRGNAGLGGYWTIELFESGYHAYAWRRLLTISAEDC